MRNLFILILAITLLFTGSYGLAAPDYQSHSRYGYKHPVLFENGELLTLLKLDKNQLVMELKEGKTLADIAEKQGIKPQAVIDLLEKQANQRLDQAVKDGRLNQEQAQLRRNVIKSHLKDAVEGKVSYHKGFRSRGYRLKEVATILGMTSEEMVQQLRNGKSVGEIAEEQGVSKKKLIKSLLKKEEEHITEWVERTWQLKK